MARLYTSYTTVGNRYCDFRSIPRHAIGMLPRSICPEWYIYFTRTVPRLTCFMTHSDEVWKENIRLKNQLKMSKKWKKLVPSPLNTQYKNSFFVLQGMWVPIGQKEEKPFPGPKGQLGRCLGRPCCQVPWPFSVPSFPPSSINLLSSSSSSLCWQYSSSLLS